MLVIVSKPLSFTLCLMSVLVPLLCLVRFLVRHIIISCRQGSLRGNLFKAAKLRLYASRIYSSITTTTAVVLRITMTQEILREGAGHLSRKKEAATRKSEAAALTLVKVKYLKSPTPPHLVPR